MAFFAPGCRDSVSFQVQGTLRGPGVFIKEFFMRNNVSLRGDVGADISGEDVVDVPPL